MITQKQRVKQLIGHPEKNVCFRSVGRKILFTWVASASIPR